ncbi:alpha/beta fold hydrolase [Caenimonas aquaedulcis]|uniref:Alpha/beta hydrolase n=1 Tax=Caenimonas aquaedulcis TaxID=2793270 RepID=A0A931H5W6_9BURK|nr:alpha/beta hydrolase [Caenimonas aquaedulcis]MBG9389018.1 alpha/beta hydrolase [Caenimonas aquaedulcis]
MKNFLLRCLLLLLGGAFFFGLIGLVLTWAPDVPVEQLTARWARPPSQFIDINGMQAHLRDEGPHDDPAPIVLLHGTSASLHTWEGWAQALREKRRVIRLDLPGFALTGPNRQDDYSTATYVTFVRALVDKLGVQRFVIGGNSLGGQVAWSVAAQMPDRIAGLILVDASGYPPESFAGQRSVPLGFRIATTPGLRTVMQYTLPRGVVERSVRNVYGDPSKVTPELVDLYMDMTRREGNRRALGRRFEQGYTADVSQLKKITAPTLILWGGKDRLVPVEAGRRFAKDIAGAKLVVYEDLGHVPQEEDPARTVADVRRFLAP